MSYIDLQGILDYGTTYRVRELEELINATGPEAFCRALCVVLTTLKANLPEGRWEKIRESLLKVTADSLFDKYVEEEEDEIG